MNDRPALIAEKPARASHSIADNAFVLHTYPYRETSVIAEVFTHSHGRIVLVAKGAKRPRSTTRGVLQPFQPLAATWFGRSEMKTLKSVEQERILPQLSGAALLSAFYTNELLLKLTHRDDPHEGLFEAYSEALHIMTGISARGGDAVLLATTLRIFEVRLLRELGYALQLAEEADSHIPIDPLRDYAYHIERGPVPAGRAAKQAAVGDALQLSGKTLLDMAKDDYRDPQTLAQAKQLMRRLVNHLLGDRVLHTRNLIRELK
jgi:DNA repair protein RecO (recombination protein O)